jgi:hypothetical protein
MSDEAPPKFSPERRASVIADAEGLANEDDAAQLGMLAPQQIGFEVRELMKNSLARI